MSVAALQPFYEGWAKHQALVIEALVDLTPEQLGFRTASHLWSVWQLAGHIAGSRAYWFHDVLGEGDPATRDLFRVDRTTVPGLRAGGRRMGGRRGPPQERRGTRGRAQALLDDG